MTLDEFLKHVYYTERSIVVPSIQNGYRISKTQFMKRGRLDSNKVKIYLTELYNNKHK